jgi:hypothetical protein
MNALGPLIGGGPTNSKEPQTPNCPPPPPNPNVVGGGGRSPGELLGRLLDGGCEKTVPVPAEREKKSTIGGGALMNWKFNNNMGNTSNNKLPTAMATPPPPQTNNSDNYEDEDGEGDYEMHIRGIPTNFSITIAFKILHKSPFWKIMRILLLF